MATVQYQQSVLGNTGTVIIQPNQQSPGIVSATPQRTMNVKVIKGLGITQIIIGVITFLFGVAATSYFDKDYSLTESGAGIWSGFWIVVTGIIGVISALRPMSGVLNGTHMAFSIISTVLAFIDGILFASGLALYSRCKELERKISFTTYASYYSINHYYNNYYGYIYRFRSQNSYSYTDYRYYYTYKHQCDKHKNAGRSIYAMLFLLMVAEFFIAMIAAIYCCRNTNNCCTPTNTSGRIIRQNQPGCVVTNTSGQVLTMHSYPQNYNPHYMVPQYNDQPPPYHSNQPQYNDQPPPYHSNQPVIMQQAPQNITGKPVHNYQPAMVQNPPQNNTIGQSPVIEATPMEGPSGITN